ncbi:wnt inhibitor of Dorsal protein [Eupeodes corollae]|uniref:wnt inhibitor of Dorsal protein n=1 Tax=Eupeodes corollae TaxID=290404 RepID=UPI00248FC912|nr:wnt inhibitor of Dorsal protein [Eupeodes corollae]
MKKNLVNILAILIVFVINSVQGLLDAGDIIATKIGLIHNIQFKSTFPLKDTLGPSLELALASCQEGFKWDRWNCPSTDFLSKRNSKHLDRESSYVVTITTAALIYTITKNCSASGIPGCGCAEDKTNQFAKCSDDTDYAEQVVGTILNNSQDDSLDVQAYAVLHNNRAAKIAVRQSLRRYCRCDNEPLPCNESKKCWHSLRPFSEIAGRVRKMYENALVVNADNSGVVNWKHIPEDVLVFVEDSPNYCKSNAIAGWTGMRGRQCSRERGSNVSQQERQSCRNLCRSCGLRTRGQAVVVKKRCNCRFSWCCEVKCEICVSVEKQHYCD